MTKVKVKTSFAKGLDSFAAGDVIELEDKAAFSMAQAGIVEYINKTTFTKALKSQEDEAVVATEREAELNALMHKETIELELNSLYLAVVEKEAELSGVMLDEEQTRTLVEELKKGRDSVSQDNNSTNG